MSQPRRTPCIEGAFLGETAGSGATRKSLRAAFQLFIWDAGGTFVRTSGRHDPYQRPLEALKIPQQM